MSAEGTQPLTFQWQRDERGHRRSDGGDVHVAVGGPVGQRRIVPGGRDERDRHGDQQRRHVDRHLEWRSHGEHHGARGRSTYSAGDTIDYSGTGSDPEDGTLPPSAFTWRVDFHHDTHFHPAVPDTSGESGSFTTPNLGDPSANVWYRIHLTVRDSSGLTSSSFEDVLPNTVNLDFETNPPGLAGEARWTALATPASIESVVGMQRTIGVVSPQTLNDQTYVFSSWAHGGAATQDIQTPTVDTTYIANYVLGGGGTFSDAFDRPDSANVGNDWLEVSDGLSISGNELRSAPTKNLFQMAIVPAFSSADADRRGELRHA